MYLFELASRHMNWVAERQSVTAVNIANADTPGFQARDTAAFSAALNQAEFQLVETSKLHMPASAGTPAAFGQVMGSTWASSASGNTVSIEQELLKAGSNSRMMNLDAGLSRSFHRMILSSLKV